MIKLVIEQAHHFGGGTGFTESLARARGLKPVSATARMKSLFPMMPGASDLVVKIVADAGSGHVLGGQIVAEVSTTDKVDLLSLSGPNRGCQWLP
ncbi:MAG: hypothetical protein GWP17_06920, partial [Aquificales bacterium]|nr:hypothetical protein [Aquificales bacterium]